MPTFTYSPHFKGKVITNSTSLNVRKSPDTNSASIHSLSKGAICTFAGCYLSGSSEAQAWLCCDYDNDGRVNDGFVSAQYIGWDSTLNTGNVMYAYVDISSGYLNLRKTPSTSATSIGKLYADDIVLWLNYEVVLNQGGWTDTKWAHVATPVGTGWVLSQYLDRRG